MTQPKNNPTPEPQPSSKKPKITRVLVSLPREVLEQIRQAIIEINKTAPYKVTLPRFLSYVIHNHWQDELEELRKRMEELGKDVS